MDVYASPPAAVPLSAAPADAVAKDAAIRERVARAIWNIRREEEDRCDMELEDMERGHSVWREADAAIDAAQLAEVTSERNDYKQAVDDLGLTPEEARAGAKRSRDMKQQLLSTQARAARLVEALEFYANDNHVEYLHGKRDWESDRAALRARGFSFEGEDGEGETFVERGNMAQAALSTPINLDALHEDRARTLEEAAKAGREAPGVSMYRFLMDRAAAERAKKEEK